jgi:hypothetical protein
MPISELLNFKVAPGYLQKFEILVKVKVHPITDHQGPRGGVEV